MGRPITVCNFFFWEGELELKELDLLRIFQRDIFSINYIHFPYFNKRINSFPDIEIKDDKLKEIQRINYKD